MNFLIFLFLSTSSLRQAIPGLSEPLELVSSQFFSAWSRMCNDRVKKERRHFLCGCDSNEKILENEKRYRDREKVKKQDEISTIVVNYSDKINRK